MYYNETKSRLLRLNKILASDVTCVTYVNDTSLYQPGTSPADTLRNNDVVVTSTQRHFGVIT